MLAAFPNLKFITTRSTGFDHIDLDACKARGVTVAYVPGYGDNTVAEFAFGLMLNLTRKIYRGINRIKETRSFSLEGLRGFDIKGKTIGIIGTGRIGRESIAIAKGFGMNVLAYDFSRIRLANARFQYVSRGTFGNSDIVSLHCPLTKETEHLLNATTIRADEKRRLSREHRARADLSKRRHWLRRFDDGSSGGRRPSMFSRKKAGPRTNSGSSRIMPATREALVRFSKTIF